MIILSLLIVSLFFDIPLLSLLLNLAELFGILQKMKLHSENTIANINEIILTLIGPIVFFVFFINGLYEYSRPLTTESSPMYHTPIAGEHIFTVVVFTCLAIASFWILNVSEGRLPPIIGCITLTFCFIGIVLNIALIVQLLKIKDIYIWWLIIFYPLNTSILYINTIRKNANLFIKRNNDENRYSSNAFLNFLYRSMLSISFRAYPLILIMFIPLLIIVQIILMLFGQKPDSIIKAMTQTCDWTFSQHTPPPIIEIHDNTGHYLCTVAAKGHKRLVKPIRYGIRHGGIIKVNRQLLVANAFENLLEEYVPPIHRFIRRVYNRIGIPLYRYINNPWASDVVYILMKPLELFFIFCLYCVDANPENRINRQYLPPSDI